MDLSIIVKAQKIVDYQGRPRCKDFTRDTTDVINIASELFKVYLVVYCAFPTSAMMNDWILKIWVKACEIEDVQIGITNEVHSMVSNFYLLGFETEQSVVMFYRSFIVPVAFAATSSRIHVR